MFLPAARLFELELDKRKPLYCCMVWDDSCEIVGGCSLVMKGRAGAPKVSLKVFFKSPD